MASETGSQVPPKRRARRPLGDATFEARRYDRRSRSPITDDGGDHERRHGHANPAELPHADVGGEIGAAEEKRREGNQIES
jgi:hypothetical protein